MLGNRSFFQGLTILGLAAMIFVMPSAHAGLIFDSGVELSEIDSGLNSTTPGAYGDDFTLGAAAVIDEIQWTGRYLGPIPIDDFTIRIYDFSGPAPSDVPLFSFDVGGAVNRVDLSGSIIYGYRASISPTALVAGRYLLSIDNDTGPTVSPWFWSADFDGGDGVYVGGPPFFPDLPNNATTTLDFALYGSSVVPEPASRMLLTIGALGLMGCRALRSRRSA